MNPTRSISWFLVRYGRLERVGWFGTVHSISYERSEQVVVSALEGEWIGTILEASELGDRPSQQAGFRPTGEILRRVTLEDREREALAGHVGLQLRESIRERMLTDVVVLDTDVTLDRRVGCVQFLGTPSENLGRLAVSLSREHRLERVQWIAGELLKIPDSDSVVGDCRGTESVSQSDEQKKVDADEPVRDFPWVRLISQTEVSSLVQGSRRFRSELGLLGLYLQKVSRNGSVLTDFDSNEPESLLPVSKSFVREWMVRLRFAGGRMLASQLLGLLDVVDELAQGSLRLTMRQGVQIHGVVPGKVGPLLAQLDRLALVTRGSCGDAVRNVTCCAHTPRTTASMLAQRLARQLTVRWLPSAPWCELAVETSCDEESESSSRSLPRSLDPTYPEGYLPHKWKIGVATASDNCVNVLVNDLGLVVRSAEASSGDFLVDCYVGGGLSYRVDDPRSCPQLAKPLGSLVPEAVEPLTEVLLKIYREFFERMGVCEETSGRRLNRHQRRWKHVVGSMGIEWLREEVSRRMRTVGYCMGECDPNALRPWSAHSAWEPDGQGTWDWCMPVLTGRIITGRRGAEESCENGMFPSRGFTGGTVREVLALANGVTVGPRHSLVFHGLGHRERNELEARGGRHDSAEATGMRVLTCVAKPTCPFALEETERAYVDWVGAVSRNRVLLEEAGRKTRKGGQFTVAISGCPHGCAQSLVADLGIVAEGPGRFRIYQGGDGVRLGTSGRQVSSPDELGEGPDELGEGPRELGEGPRELGEGLSDE